MVHRGLLKICLGEDLISPVYNAILPDNSDAPPFIKLSTFMVGSCFVVDVRCSGKIGSLLTTLDDLIESVQIAVKSIGSVQQSYKSDLLNEKRL